MAYRSLIIYGRHTDIQMSSFHYGQDVGVLVQQVFLVLQLHLGSSVLGQQYCVPHSHAQLDVLTLLVEHAGAHLHDRPVVVVAPLLQDDARGRLGLGLQLPNQDPVEGGQQLLEGSRSHD
jgi:hypothetical protein